MDLSTRTRLYNAFHPLRVLDWDDPYNVDIDRMEPETRGLVWAAQLANQVALAESPEQVFFSGLRGTGKSTELRRMAHRLRSAEHGQHLVAFVDAKEHLDLQNDIDVPDVLATLTHGAEVEVLTAEGKTPAAAREAALEDGFSARLWNWLTDTDLELGKAEFQIPSGPKLVAEMRSRPKLRKRLRQTLNAHINHFTGGVRNELESLNRRAHHAGYPGGLAVVYDSLEKLKGTSETFDRVLRSAERVFDRDAPWFDLPVSCIWTVPAALVTRTRVDVSFLPMVRHHRREDASPFDGGFRILREIVHRRASDDDLRLLLGDAFEHRLYTLFEASGGYVRDLLRMLQKVALFELPASEDDVGRVAADLADEIVRIVPTEAYPWLRRVAAEHSIATANDEEKALADWLIGNNVVLRYQNRTPWFDVHPAARTILAAPGGGDAAPQ